MTKKLAPVATFRTGFAASRFAICLSGAMDALSPNEPYSRIYIFNQKHTNLWTFNEHEFSVPSVCLWHDPAPGSLRYFAALSEQGEVVILTPELVHERIHDAGVNHVLAKGYGYLNAIRQIGEHIYACGFSGQVYRRNGPNDWVHVDDGVLQPPGLDRGQYFAQVIDGPHERAIYLAGCELTDGQRVRADFWDGSSWNRLPLPITSGRITDIYVESENRILMCGDNGILLLGNAHQGFSAIGPRGAAQLFTSLTKFRNLYYLGSNLGLFLFDPAAQEKGFARVHTHLEPELQDANVVQAVGDVLWSMGAKDLARFDGVQWERFDHPDNPPIGTKGTSDSPRTTGE